MDWPHIKKRNNTVINLFEWNPWGSNRIYEMPKLTWNNIAGKMDKSWSVIKDQAENRISGHAFIKVLSFPE